VFIVYHEPSIVNNNLYGYLFFTRLYLVAAKVFLGFDVERVFANQRIILAQLKLVRGILCIFNGIVSPVSGFFAHKSN
jgi:hypothetical protein